MGIKIIEDIKEGYKVLYCSTSMVCFGDVFYMHEDVTSFLDWLKIDARKLNQKELSKKISEWRCL